MRGGAGEHDAFVAAASDLNRARFVQNLLRTMDDLGYDGIDVDWEPILPGDRQPLLALLRELRAARPGIILTIPVGWVNANFPGEVDGFYAELAGLVDQMNVMSYDMAGNYGGWESWHSSALYGHAPSRPSSIESTVDRYLAVGVPPGRLGIGVGFYGSCWRGVTEPRVPLDGRDVSQGNSDNAMSYANIMRDYRPAATRHFDAAAQVPYLSSAAGAGPQRCNFISYEDAESIAAKGAFVRDRGLGGAIVWTINQGHLPDAPAGGRDPLMRAMQAAFLAP
jgi:GH18 family chitinase